MTDDVDKSVKRSSEIFRGFNGQTDGRTDTGPWLVGYRGCIASLGRKKRIHCVIYYSFRHTFVPFAVSSEEDVRLTRAEQHEADRSVDDHSRSAAELDTREYLAEQNQKRADGVQNLRRHVPFCDRNTHAA